MKSKNLFSSMKNVGTNLKNNKYINPAIITIIVVFSIYLLYFNDKIYVQDSITNSLNENNNTSNNEDTNENSDQDYFIENFDVGKYVDVCKNRNTHIYNLRTGTGTGVTEHQGSKTMRECETLCTNDNCKVFALNNTGKCITYIGTPSRATGDPIKVSCNSKIFVSPNNNGANTYNTGPYNGIGYINKNYFEYNKSDLSYIDPFLKESREVLADLQNIQSQRNELNNLTPAQFNLQYQTKLQDILTDEIALFNKFDRINSEIMDISPIDNSRNRLFTDMFKTTTDIPNTILAPTERSTELGNTFFDYLDDKYDKVKISNNLDGVLDVKSENFVVNNVRYLILAVIMIITIIILILYKSSNFINEKILIAYIIIVTFLVLFITQQLKL
jgi:hypothetical protein